MTARYDGGIEMEARSQIGGRGAATTGTATTESGAVSRTQQSRAHFPKALVAGGSLFPYPHVPKGQGFAEANPSK